MKAKRRRLIIAAAAVVLLGAAWLWYTRPMTLEQLCPGVSLSGCSEINGSYSLPNSNSVSFSLTADDPAFESLLAQLEGRTFRRSVRGLLLAGRAKTHIGWSPKDTCWDIHLYFDAVTLPNGEEVRGALIWLDNFYGSLRLSYAGQTAWDRMSTTDKQQWLTDVQAVLSGQ